MRLILAALYKIICSGSGVHVQSIWIYDTIKVKMKVFNNIVVQIEIKCVYFDTKVYNFPNHTTSISFEMIIGHLIV